MNLCTPFILRPVATTLLTLGLALAGAVAFFMLPVAPLPQVDSPRISISASLPGASPETMASSVAMPLERALGRIAGITEMTSSSSLGSTRISVEFDLNRDIDGAARDVQGAINAARALLPTGLPNNPTYRKINPADAPIMMLALTSQSKSRGQLYDVASTVIAQKLSQIEGVGQVSVSGSSLPAVRVELNPYALNHYGISLSDVRTAIAATNANRPKGSLVDGDRHWQILANDQAFKAREYEPLIVGYKDGAAVRLADVAQVLDSVEDLRNAGSANGKPSVLLQIFRQPNANIIETIDRVKEELHQVRASIPTAIDVDVMMDRSPSIRASLHEVEKTLVISVGLVIMVVFLFLRNARAALIPSVAVPVSLISTFAAMYLCGFSLNNISLMALTVATGFVVDDAIVVIENINRYLEKGERPLRAALLGAQEVGFTVVSMSFSLVAVFIPLLLMGGLIGRQFREFAVTLSVAILVSLVVSLTLTPMMCSRLLNKQTLEGENNNRLSRWGKQIFDAMLAFYRRSLAWALDHPRLIMFILLATIGLNIHLYIIVPKGFFPQQDIGRIMGSIEADQSISFQAMQPKLDRFVELVREDPAVESVTAFTGGGRRNSGSMFINLKPLSEREDSAAQVINRLRKTLAHEPGATLYMRAAQDIRVGGRSSSAEYQYTLQADDLEELRSWEPQVRRAMSQVNEIVDVNTDEQQRGLQTELVVDRDAAMRLGVDMRTIDDTLNNAFGQRQVSTIYNPLNQYRVVMELAPQYWQHPEALQLIHVFNKDGERVPLSAFSSYRPTLTSLSVNHQGQFAASTISFNLAEGVSLSQAQTAVRDAMERIGLPTSVRGSFQGTARAFQASMESQPWLILAALVAVYIVLGILYESYVHPLTILSTLPSAGVGAILALMLFKTEFSMIAFIGVILLIGIVKKNAIMMIDFALQAERSRNLNSRQAIFEACLLRFRPIMMTTLAAALGAIPLAIGSGDGAELRRPLGMSIVGGLLVSQLLTLYTTPVVYIYLDHFGLYWRRLRNKGRPASSAEGHGVAQPVFQENPL